MLPLYVKLAHVRPYFSLCVVSFPRSNMRSVFSSAIVFAFAQSIIYFMFSAGFSFSAFLVSEGRGTYDEMFRLVCNVYIYYQELLIL